MARIEAWEIVLTFDGKYALHGQVFEHPDPIIFDGQVVTTSPLVRIDFANLTAETKNTFYHLVR